MEEQKQLWKRVFQASGSQMDPVGYCANHWTVLSNREYAELLTKVTSLEADIDELLGALDYVTEELRDRGQKIIAESIRVQEDIRKIYNITAKRK